MSGYVVLPRARADLREIWSYTADRWSEDQADRYLARLHRGIETIVRDPRRGRRCDHIREGYQQFSVGAHVLFFRSQDNRVEIVRILHQSMDFEQHL